jgi:hypothetical protein
MPTTNPAAASQAPASAALTSERTLRISKRLRNLHRRAKSAASLKAWALKLAAGASFVERRTIPGVLDRRGALTDAALAYHWLAGRNLARGLKIGAAQ